MKKIIKVCSFFIATIFIIFLASCNKDTFEVSCNARVTARKDQITVSADFIDSKERIFDEVTPYVAIYEIVDGKEQDQKDSNSFSIKTGTEVTTNTSSNEVVFKNLTEMGKYKVKIFATYNSKNYTLYDQEHELSNLGTKDNPIEITTKEEFINTIPFDRTGYFKLTTDLDFADSEGKPGLLNSMWTTSSEPFAGELDGQGHTIKNFKINATNTYSGLIGYNKGTIKNLNIDSATLDINKSSDINAGILCGTSKGTIDNINIKNSQITGKDNTFSYKHKFNIGLLVGTVEESTISKVLNSTVTNSKVDKLGAKLEANIGGLIGEIAGSKEFRRIPVVENNKVENTTMVIDQKIETSISYAVTINVGGLVGQAASNISKSIVNNTNITLNTDVSPKATVTSGLEGYDVSLGGVVGKSLVGSMLDNVMFKGELTLNTNLKYDKPANEEEKIDTIFNGYVGGVVGNDISSKTHKNILADAKKISINVTRENATGDVTINHGLIYGYSKNFNTLKENNVINYNELEAEVKVSENVVVNKSTLINLSKELEKFDEIIKNIYAK